MKTTKKTIGLCRTRDSYYTEGTTREATDSETELGLALKLHEEVSELVRAPHDHEEYADVLQALRDYAQLHRIPWETIEMVTEAKCRDRGPFLPGLLWRAE